MTAPSRTVGSFRSATAAKFALAFGVLVICLVLEVVLGSSHASSALLLAVAAAGIVFGGGGALVTARRMDRAIAYNIERQNAIRHAFEENLKHGIRALANGDLTGPPGSEDQGDRARPAQRRPGRALSRHRGDARAVPRVLCRLQPGVRDAARPRRAGVEHRAGCRGTSCLSMVRRRAGRAMFWSTARSSSTNGRRSRSTARWPGRRSYLHVGGIRIPSALGWSSVPACWWISSTRRFSAP